MKKSFINVGPPPVPILSCVNLSKDVSGAVNVTVNWTLSDGGNADFYLINITTNAPLTPYGGLLNISASASVILYELTGFKAGYEYSVTVRSICGSKKSGESKLLTINPQGIYIYIYIYIYNSLISRLISSSVWVCELS